MYCIYILQIIIYTLSILIYANSEIYIRAETVALLVAHLPSMQKALGSITNTLSMVAYSSNVVDPCS